VLNDSFVIKKGWMTTIHSYTNDQNILDLPHKDLRRARAAALSMIPTTTGAAKAVGEVLPALKGKLDGFAMRCRRERLGGGSGRHRREEDDRRRGERGIPGRGRRTAEGDPGGRGRAAGVDRFPRNPNSSIVDAAYTKVMDSDFVKVLSWYDNEWGYSMRCVDLMLYMASKGI